MEEEKLSKSFGYLGFGNDKLTEQYREKRKTSGKEPIHIEIKSKDNTILYRLVLNYSEKFDRYFINRINATKVGLPEVTFTVGKENNFTKKEIYNLLNERAVYKMDMVNKEGGKYNAWFILNKEKIVTENGYPNFVIYTDEYRFDLRDALNKNVFLVSDEQEGLLKKGDEIEMKYDGKKYKIRTNPEERDILIKDEGNDIVLLSGDTLVKLLEARNTPDEVYELRHNDSSLGEGNNVESIKSATSQTVATTSILDNIAMDYKEKTGETLSIEKTNRKTH